MYNNNLDFKKLSVFYILVNITVNKSTVVCVLRLSGYTATSGYIWSHSLFFSFNIRNLKIIILLCAYRMLSLAKESSNIIKHVKIIKIKKRM